MKTSEETRREKELRAQDKCNRKFLNAINICVSCNKKDVNITEVEKLVQAGADINCFDDAGYTAATIILKSDEPIKINLLKYLLSLEQLDVNFAGDSHSQITLLERAAEIEDHNDALEICKILVKRGARISNAIYYAKNTENQELIEFLKRQKDEQIVEGTFDRTDDVQMQVEVEMIGQEMKDSNLMQDL